MQNAHEYDHRAVKSAVSHFTKRANGFFDAAFEYQDIKQEAAIAYWLSKEKTAKSVFNDVVDSWRKINFGKRSSGHFPFVSDDVLSLDSSDYLHFDSHFFSDLSKTLKKISPEWPEIENFIILYYIESLPRKQIKHRLNIGEYLSLIHI